MAILWETRLESLSVDKAAEKWNEEEIRAALLWKSGKKSPYQDTVLRDRQGTSEGSEWHQIDPK